MIDYVSVLFLYTAFGLCCWLMGLRNNNQSRLCSSSLTKTDEFYLLHDHCVFFCGVYTWYDSHSDYPSESNCLPVLSSYSFSPEDYLSLILPLACTSIVSFLFLTSCEFTTSDSQRLDSELLFLCSSLFAFYFLSESANDDFSVSLHSFELLSWRFLASGLSFATLSFFSISYAIDSYISSLESSSLFYGYCFTLSTCIFISSSPEANLYNIWSF